MALFRRRFHAPLSQTCTVGEFSPTLASRGAQSECRATPWTQIDTGFNLRVPNSSARAGFSVSTVRCSIMSVRDTNFFQEAESKFRILGGRYSYRTRGRKARREGGGDQDNPRDEQSIRSVLEHDEHSERVQFWRVIKQLRRGAGNRSARVLILTFRRCQGREKFCRQRLANFSALFLDKKGGNSTAMGRVGGAHS